MSVIRTRDDLFAITKNNNRQPQAVVSFADFIMKIAILGSTGPTGILLTQHAIDCGHDVVALARNPQKIQLQHERLTVAEGDIFNEDYLVEHFRGCDAVLSCLGSKLSFFSRITFYKDSITVIISAMRKAEVKRLVAMTSWCTVYNPDDPGPVFMEWFFKPVVIRTVLASMAEMEEYLDKECQDIDFTIVRPPGLKTAPPTDKVIKTEERQFVGGGSMRMHRGDVARFMLDVIDKEKWFKKYVAIAVDC